MTPSLHKLLLVAILLIAGWSRFVGIDHHLRRAGPDFDEANNFVEPVQRMWEMPTADPTVYTGYPGFFNWLAFFPIGVGERLGGEVGAYVGGRVLVAVAGVASVLLAYLLARHLAGPPAGLLAAALLAVSRGEIRAAHYITPDVLVATAALSLVLIAARTEMALGPAAALGAVCGVAVAIKYTGLFLAPGVGAAIASNRRRWRLWLLAGLAALVVFAITAPYAVARLGGGAAGAGFSRAVADYFGSGYASNRVAGAEPGALAGVLWLLFLNLGAVGLVLAVAGAVMFRPWTLVGPAAAIVAFGIVAMIPAKLVYPRHVLTVSAVAAVLAAVGAREVVRRTKPGFRPMVVAALAAATLWAPAQNGLRLAARYARTPAIDAAAAWIEASPGTPALIGTSLPRFRLDPERFEVRSAGDDVPREVLAHYPLLVVAPREAGDWPIQACFGAPGEEQPLVIATPPKPDLRLLELRWANSESDPRVEGVAGVPFRVERIEIEGDVRAVRTIALEARKPGQPEFEPFSGWPLRPGRLARQRPGAPTGQIYVVWPPVMVKALRIRHDGTALTRIKVYGPVEAPRRLSRGG